MEKSKKRKRRKFKPDNIRKKIKARFHKDLKNIINKKLKKLAHVNYLIFYLKTLLLI